ncbi:MAG: hypothetical protein HOV81_41740 [Kofleriaceae bacterium]|nr:hypothetical protein [Kofleriaceae bacterium]
MPTVELCEARVELVAADALLVPVDGQVCRLGGAPAAALRAALSDDERADELEYVEDALARLRPLPHPSARALDGVARWSSLVVSAAYPHNVDGAIFSPHDCARMIRAAIPVALATAAEHGISAIAATLIGTAYRMPADLAVRAFADGVAASTAPIIVRWSLPDASHRDLARDAIRRLAR